MARMLPGPDATVPELVEAAFNRIVLGTQWCVGQCRPFVARIVAVKRWMNAGARAEGCGWFFRFKLTSMWEVHPAAVPDTGIPERNCIFSRRIHKAAG